MLTETAEIEPVAQKRVSPRSCQHDLRVREQCEALYKSGWMPAQISKQTGVNRGTIFQWAKRYGWTESRDKVGQLLANGVAATIAEKISQRSEEVRDKLSQGLVSQADILADHPPKSFTDVAGGKGTRGHAETALTLINASEKLFGWNQQSGPGCLIQVNYLNDIAPAKPATEPAVNV